MKHKSRKMQREQQRAFELWTSVTLFTVIGAYLGTWLLLYILKAVLS